MSGAGRPLREVAQAVTANGVTTITFPAVPVSRIWTGSIFLDGVLSNVTWKVQVGGFSWGAIAGSGPYNVQAMSGESIVLSTTSSPVSPSDQTARASLIGENNALGSAVSFLIPSAPSGYAVGVSGPEVSTLSLPSGTVGVAYAATLLASGGSPPYSWSIHSGTLPAGLSLANDGSITGTPTTAIADTFTVEVTDTAGETATQSLALTIGAAPLPSAPNGAILVGMTWDGTNASNQITVDVDGVTSGDELLVLWGMNSTPQFASANPVDTFSSAYSWSIFAQPEDGTTAIMGAALGTGGKGSSGFITLTWPASTQGGVFVYALHGMGAVDKSESAAGAFPLAPASMAPSVSGEVLVTACTYIPTSGAPIMDASPSTMPSAFQMAVAPVTSDQPGIGPVLAATSSGINTGTSVAPTWSNPTASGVSGVALSILVKPA